MKLDRRALVVVVAATALAAPALALAVDQTPDTGGGSAVAGNAATSPVKGDTAKFADLAVAKQAGYGLLKDKQGISCIAMDPMPGMTMGAMGVHYASPATVSSTSTRRRRSCTGRSPAASCASQRSSTS
jgi:hypothetical protein